MNAIYRSVALLYGDNGRYLPGIYMLPRMGLKDGIKNQWTISVGLSRWLISSEVIGFAVERPNKDDLNHILKCFRILGRYIEDDTAEIVAKLDEAWKEKCKTVLNLKNFDESTPLVKAGLFGGRERFIGVYVANILCDSYDVVLSATTCRDEKENVVPGSKEPEMFTHKPGKPEPLRQSTSKMGFEQECLLYPRSSSPFKWTHFGWLDNPHFTAMVYWASWVGLRKSLKQLISSGKGCPDDDSKEYVLLERPFEEIARRAKELRDLCKDGSAEDIESHLREYVLLCPLHNDDGVPDDEDWLVDFHNRYIGNGYSTWINDYREASDAMDTWDKLAKSGNLHESEVKYRGVPIQRLDVEDTLKHMEYLKVKIDRLIDSVDRKKEIKYRINDESIPEGHPFLNDEPMPVFAVGVPTPVPKDGKGTPDGLLL